MPKAEQGYVYYREGLDTGERDAVLDALPGLNYVIHHSDNQLHFDAWPPENLKPYGQAFGPELEARWSPGDNGSWEILVLSESAQTLSGWNPPTVMQVDAEVKIQLWGRRWREIEEDNETDPLWVEAQVDSWLKYPIPAGEKWDTVAVKAHAYSQGGVVCLTRLFGLEKGVDYGTKT